MILSHSQHFDTLADPVCGLQNTLPISSLWAKEKGDAVGEEAAPVATGAEGGGNHHHHNSNNDKGSHHPRYTPYHTNQTPRNQPGQQQKIWPYNPNNYSQYWHHPPQGPNIWEGNQIFPDLPPPGSNPLEVHNSLLIRADASRELFVRFQQDIQNQFNVDGSGRGLWDFLQQFTGVDSQMCMFMHPAGIKKDVSGDTLMSDGPNICECMTGQFYIPECFLRAFFYLITVSNHRKEVLVKFQEERAKQAQQKAAPLYE